MEFSLKSCYLFIFSSLTHSPMLRRFQLCSVIALAVAFFLYYEFFLVCSQTEDPAMERPYTFKDFLLRPRRSVFTFVFTSSLPENNDSQSKCLTASAK